tara:strand:- start:1901 stop:2125 length:225 start_codon:yes stop_codon:yes gene_type:complete
MYSKETDIARISHARFSQGSREEAPKPVEKSNGLLTRRSTPMTSSDTSSSDKGALIAQTAFNAIRRKRQEMRNA